MKSALLFVVLASQPVLPVSDRVPDLKIAALCKASAAEDKAMNLANPQSFEDCMFDEGDALHELTELWPKVAVPLRDRCEREALGEFQSYVELLTCVQMANGLADASPAVPPKGAAKNRKKK